MSSRPILITAGVAATALVAGGPIRRLFREREATRLLAGTHPTSTPGLAEGAIHHGRTVPALTDQQAQAWGRVLAGTTSLNRLARMNTDAHRGSRLPAWIARRGSHSEVGRKAGLRSLNARRVLAAALRQKADWLWESTRKN